MGLRTARTSTARRMGMNTSSLRVGQDVTRVGAYAFRCEVCGRRYTQDDRYEPLCTGPTWRDEHEPTVMMYAGPTATQAYTSVTLR
jgi:rRNA maturation endonuclease Nob1